MSREKTYIIVDESYQGVLWWRLFPKYYTLAVGECLYFYKLYNQQVVKTKATLVQDILECY